MFIVPGCHDFQKLGLCSATVTHEKSLDLVSHSMIFYPYLTRAMPSKRVACVPTYRDCPEAIDV